MSTRMKSAKAWCVSGAIVLAAGLAAVAHAGPVRDGVHGNGGGQGNPAVMPPSSVPAGRTYGEWAAAYDQWVLSIPMLDSFLDDGHSFGLHQSGPTWFLQPGCLDRNCTMPASKFLWAPILFTWNEYPCPDTAFHPAAGQTMEDFLLSGYKAFFDANPPTDGALVVDGRPLINLGAYRGTSRLFTVTIDPSLLAIDPCVTADPQPCVADGYWVMLKPFSPGPHTLEYPGCDIIHLNVVDDAAYAAAGGAAAPARVTPAVPVSWGKLKAIYR